MLCGTVRADDFESYPVGNPIGGNNGWKDVLTSAGQGFTVAAVNSTLSEGAQSLHFTDTDTDGGLTDARIQNIFSSALPSAVVTFDFMAPTAAQTPILTIRDGKIPVSPQAVVLTISPGGAGAVNYHDGTVWQKIPAGLKQNTWYHFVITIADASAGTFDLSISDKKGELLSKKGLSFRMPVKSLYSLDFATNAGPGKSGGDFYIDNFSVTPAAAQ
jgi:hypothetical protein